MPMLVGAQTSLYTCSCPHAVHLFDQVAIQLLMLLVVKECFSM